jgi:hypothetical protein
LEIVTQRKLKKSVLAGLPFKKRGINPKLYLFKQNQKTENMKKLFFVFAIAALAACNNGKEEESTSMSATTESSPVTVATPTLESTTTTDSPSTTATTGK